MAIEAQRIHKRAEDLREQRREREESRGGLDPDENPTVREGPVVTEESEIARSEALSAMVTPDQMRGQPLVDTEAVAEQAESALVELGAELSGQVDARLEEFRQGIASELEGVTGSGSVPKGFVYGSLWGAAVCLGSLAGAIFLARISRKE